MCGHGANDESLLPIMKKAATDHCLGLSPKIQHQVSFRQISGSYSVIKLQFGFQAPNDLNACRKKSGLPVRCGRFSFLGRSAVFHQVSLNLFGRNMKKHTYLAALVAATLPLTVPAEDTAKTETTEQNQEQSSETTGMKGMDMGQMMSNSKDQDAELDKLVAEMTSASTDNKLEAIAAVLIKLVEQRKAMHEQMQKMMSANDKEGMSMGRMTGCDHDGKHSHHH
jgi:hypothetical protein